jgi:hypothetical protein
LVDKCGWNGMDKGLKGIDEKGEGIDYYVSFAEMYGQLRAD